jgi:hypothetical protein
MSDLPEGCSVRFYREGDEERLLPLLQDAFGRWPGVDVSVEPLEHFRWKHLSDETAKGVQAIAEAGSRAIGSRLTVAQRMKVGGEFLLARLGVDLAVHSDFQNMGLMQKMRALSNEAIWGTFDVDYGTTGNPISRRHDAQRGHQRPANAVEVLEYPLDSVAVRRGDGGRRENEWTISQPPEFDDRTDEFWEEASRPFRLIVVRKRDYLNWRYCDPRAGAFTVRLAERGERILGYAVLRVSRGKAYIADLLTLPEREDVAQSLVSDALGYFRRTSVSSVRCWLPSHHPYREALLREGFLPKRRVKGLRYSTHRAPEELLEILTDPHEAVHVTIGDTDLV